VATHDTLKSTYKKNPELNIGENMTDKIINGNGEIIIDYIRNLKILKFKKV